jgi:4-alpha-glucanotransferase
MSDVGQGVFPTPFPPEYRASGVLLHVTSLPSPYGIGDLGPAAWAWVNRLHEAGQSWWQALPLGPTGYGDSPYQSLSSFAGNELLISPDSLIEDELLRPADCERNAFSVGVVDYNTVTKFKRRLLDTAWLNLCHGTRSDLQAPFDEFLQSEKHWLEDYALFRALKAKNRGASYLDWPAELVRRTPTALDAARRELSGHVDRVCFAQFLLFRQGRRLREHAHAKGIRLIGDLPFFVSPDSSDVWANPELFVLDEQLRPRFVAGVPPDYFSADGQLWGNPVYDWGAIRETGYRWCIDRFRAFPMDLIRLDHFRAFAAAWHVPAGAVTAQTGAWVPGPGADFLRKAEKELGALPFIAEDLGLITPDVCELRDRFRLPGMRVLQFGFDGDSYNPHLPDNFTPNSVVYTGTHDNSTTRGWFEELPQHQQQHLWNYLKRPAGDSREAAAALVNMAWSSAAALAIVPLQDVLGLGREARMNLPGSAAGNWGWRCTEDMLTEELFRALHDLTKTAGRLPAETHTLVERRFG